MIDLPRLYTDDEFRERIIRRVTDPILAGSGAMNSQVTISAFALMGRRLSSTRSGNSRLRQIFGRSWDRWRPKFDLGYAMNNGRILIANLARGQIGEQAANLLGSLLVSHLQLVAMERSTLRPEDRLPFYVHVDEFQNFGTDAFASLLSEARKFATHFCLVNQFTDQLQPPVRSALLGNAGSLIVFRVGSADAESSRRSLSSAPGRDFRSGAILGMASPWPRTPVHQSIARFHSAAEAF